MRAELAGKIRRCSFCQKPINKVGALIGSPLEEHSATYICNECVAVCTSILERKRASGADSSSEIKRFFYRVKSL